MRSKLNLQQWLTEQGALPAQPDMTMAGPPTSQPGMPGDPMGDPTQNPTDMSVDPQQQDISNDPVFPEMLDDQVEEDFEIWKIKYVKESIKGDCNKLVNQILAVRNRELSAPQRRFVEDNLDINFLRQNANILQISNEIRKLIKKDFDRTNPATAVVRHITDCLDKQPLINEIYLKLLGEGASKGDDHRKFVAGMLGAVQVGVGGQNEDLIFEEQDYSIRISTRFNSRWGDVNIGRWQLKEDDHERYLKHAELDRLQAGSPEEKDVLRRRVVIESIAEMFKERAFIINVAGMDGTVYHLAWDLGNSLKSAYLDGKLVVRTTDNDARDAFIDKDGSVIAIPTMNIYYVKESDSTESDTPQVEEVEFITHRDGILFLSAQLELIKEAATTLQGILYKETIWQGNPADVLKVMRCIPSVSERLLRQC